MAEEFRVILQPEAYEGMESANERIRALFHGADRPRDEQIMETLQELHSERQMQQEIAAAIEAIRTKNRRTGLLP